MDRYLRRLGLMLGVMALALLWAGCAPVGSPAATSGSAQEPVTLTFWNMPFVTQEVSPAYVAQWEEAVRTALPNVRVDTFYGPGKYKDQRDKFLLQAESGTPDVIEGLLEDTAVYVQRGLIEPLDERFAAWEDSSQFVESTLEPLRINGKLWGIPYNTNARAMIYRKDIFEEHGLEVPKTWGELIETARKITELTNGEVHGFFLCTEVGDPRAAQEFMSWYYQVSGGQNMFEVVDGQVEFKATVEQLEQVLSLYDALFDAESVPYPAIDPNVRGTGWPVEDPGYVAGKWAMVPMGPWLWGRREEGEVAKDILENRTAITALPVAEGGVPATYLEVKPIMLNAYSRHKDEAWELIKFITSKEQMALWLADSGGIPARRDSLEMPQFTESEIGWWIQGFADQLPIAVAMAPINWGPVSEANLRAVNFVIYDEQTPAEAAQWLYDQIMTLLANGEL
ncbi:sugar ABC transporter substrate-binding protein [Litorilinea aerophila]|uniref:Sugar ABC transporter substrate-binding protein n=1 Tax=Litorilinea aerophila TaxID=1204385 RepID=A0A540VGX9_9CHLR|nr:sugar ABC transporter substrate-binding protein [Litorilinea aerophila]MCC9076419.1 sugar ABC transporter substrate-binding protein [Litorilinea aerophila]